MSIQFYWTINKVIKGTVWPDWIYMRVVSLDRPKKGPKLIKVFNFTLEYFKRLQSFEPLHAEMNPTSCLFDGLHRIQSSYWLAHFYKITVEHMQTVIRTSRRIRGLFA